MSSAIAERQYRDAVTGNPVTVTIFAPEPSGPGEWSCKLKIEGLDAPYERKLFGVDSLQALCGALGVLCAKIEPHEQHLTFLDGPVGEIGLPLVHSVVLDASGKAEVHQFVQRLEDQFVADRWPEARR